MRRGDFNGTVFIAALFCVATVVASHAQTFTSLVSFDYTNGAFPPGALMQGADGNLYGVTQGGGNYLQGTAFSMTPSGTLTTFYNFCSQKNQSLCIDGSYVNAPLIQGTNGNFYGTSRFAGNTEDVGAVFELSLSGDFTLLYSFCPGSGCTDGLYPDVPLTQGRDGNFYGTTNGGGTHAINGGTVFKITPTGTLTILYNFCARQSNGVCLDGMTPAAALLQASDGNFYGTTQFGGTHNKGTFFRITPNGKFTSLHSLSEASDANALIEGADGNLYGTTSNGGKLAKGTVFRISPAGQLTTLYNFCFQTNCSDGEFPLAGLVQGSDGSFYGTTLLGGTNNDSSCRGGPGCGTIFQITSAGKLTTLYNFCSQTNCPDGSQPEAALIQAVDGTFYGTTSAGGTTDCIDGCGTVFSLSTGALSRRESK